MLTLLYMVISNLIYDFEKYLSSLFMSIPSLNFFVHIKLSVLEIFCCQEGAVDWLQYPETVITHTQNVNYYYFHGIKSAID